MIVVEKLKELYVEKLHRTGSMDAAFTKAVWVAYNAGLADGRAECKQVGELNETCNTFIITGPIGHR